MNPFSEACKNCTKGRVLGQRDTPVCEKMLVQNTRAPILLVSTFVNHNHKHMAEVLCALAENIMSPSLQKVHALHEGSPETLIAAILNASAHYPRSNLEYEVCLPFVLSAKLVVVSTKKQASYPEMIYYACTKLGGERVLLSNTDVVFDSSLDRLERDRISFLDRQTVYVFSVTAPRADAGPYLERFNNSGWPARCAKEARTRCFLNETKQNDERSVQNKRISSSPRPGRSYDAFLFYSPLPVELLRDSHWMYPKPYPRGIFMNNLGGEHVFGYLLRLMGMKLLNPCRFVPAWHWHCSGQKMHHIRRDYVSKGGRSETVLPHGHPRDSTTILPCSTPEACLLNAVPYSSTPRAMWASSSPERRSPPAEPSDHMYA